jgi:hypothetical protein
MPVVPKRLGQGRAGNGFPALIYTVPSGKSATIRSITVANTTAFAEALSLWLIPVGGTPEDDTAIVSGLLIGANGLLQDDGVHVLEAGGMVVAQGSDDAFTVTVDGAEIS